MNDFTKRYFWLCVLIFAFCFVALPRAGHEFDQICWRNWSKAIFQDGIGNIYNTKTDYLPLYHYVLKFFSWLKESPDRIDREIHHLKLFTLLFHFLNGFFLVKLIKKTSQDWNEMLYLVLFYVLNAAVLYNTVIWGQVDEILTFLIFISCYCAYKERILASLIFATLALNLKLQAIIFLPVIGLLLLPKALKVISFKKVILWLFVIVCIQLVIIFPFIVSGTVDKLWAVVVGSVGKYPIVSISAFNIWEFLLPNQSAQVPDSSTTLGISYKSWGLLMFFSASALALFPLLKATFTAIAKRQNFYFPLDKLLLTGAIIPLLFFYLNTQMHERYSHPALIFLIGYSIYTMRPLVSIIVCFAYFLNLESIFFFLGLNNYKTLIFDHRFISGLYLTALVCLYFYLYEVKLKNLIPFRSRLISN